MALTATLTTLYHGDTPTWRIKVTTETGARYALTGHTVWVTCKQNKSSADSEAIFQLTNGSGVTLLTGSNDDSADATPASASTSGLTTEFDAYFGVRIKSPTGKIHTVYEGVLPLKFGTTKATT